MLHNNFKSFKEKHPIFSKYSQKTQCFESSRWKKQHFWIAIYANLLAVIVSLQFLRQDACSHLRKRAVAVKEWYQKQDVLNIDNLTECFWAILYKFSTTERWAIKYNSKHLEKNVHSKTVTFFISEEKTNKQTTIITSSSASQSQVLQILWDSEGKGRQPPYSDTFQPFL